MAANNLGTAYIKIAPQMDGIQSSISNGLAKIKSTSLPGAAALGTVIAKGISTAMDAVTNSLDRAISRVDTLNAFPKIMKNLGFSTEESTSAITKLSDRIEGLPTGLDEIVNYTQRLASTMGNLNDGMYNATNLAIAFNDAALAGGKGQFEANRAFEQFSQVLSRGRPSMQDWKIMMEVMPGQLKQMAKYMGENNDSLKKYAKQAGKTADQLDGMDLYEWISEDENKHAKERLEDLTKSLIDLDNKGGAGITSFKDQVGDATHTIGNALGLIPLRISKAMATVIDAFGQGDIYNAIDKFSSSFKGIGDWIAKNIVPAVKNAITVFKNVAKAIFNVAQTIFSNKAVVDILQNALTTMLAFKAASIVATKVTVFATAVKALATNLTIGTEVFRSARAAGMTFGDSLSAAGQVAGGFTGKLSALANQLFSFKTAIAGAVTAGILIFQAAMIRASEDEIIATTRAREYARSHYDLKQAAEGAKRALDLQKMSIEDLKNAQMAATNAEIEAIEAKKRQTEYQNEMNRLIKEGKQDTDDYRLAELNYTKAIEEERIANEKLAEANKEVKTVKTELDDINSSNIYRMNLAISSAMREAGEYGNLAKQLDALKDKTITYKDEHGNMVTATKEKTAEMVQGLAEQLANSSSKTGAIWREIVDIANKEGISFAEACKKYGAQGGKNITGNFKESADKNYNLVHQVGENLTLGAEAGMLSKKASFLDKAFKMIQEGVNKMKAAADVHSPSKETAEIGKFMSLGLAKGIDDYADEAISSAENMTEKTIAAMNSSMGINSNLSQYQPENGITSGMNGLGGQVTQYNNFTVNDNLDVNEISKRLGWQVATAL